MNKVITIHLGGAAYPLEEAGYEALRHYLDEASVRLSGNPDREEILADIEHAISEKFRALLNTYKTVVLAREVESVLAEMGPIEDDSTSVPGGAGASSSTPGDRGRETQGASNVGGGAGPAKRLYRIQEGAMFAGVCNGLAAYFGLDPTIVRLAFVLLTFIWGAGILVYFVMAFVIPCADTSQEKAAAFGAPFTAQEFIRRAKEGYYDALRSFPDKQKRNQWKSQFQNEMHGWSHTLHREMSASANQCRQNWERYWATGAPRAAALALPLFSLLHAILAIAWITAMVSLLSTGKVFGTLTLPPEVPVWIMMLVLLFAYGFLTWPMKTLRRAFYSNPAMEPRWAVPFICVADLLVWIGVVVVMVWLGAQFFPEVKEAFKQLPNVVQEAVNNIRDWSGRRGN